MSIRGPGIEKHYQENDSWSELDRIPHLGLEQPLFTLVIKHLLSEKYFRGNGSKGETGAKPALVSKSSWLSTEVTAV